MQTKSESAQHKKQWKNEFKVWFGVLALKLPQFMCPSNYGQKESIWDERWEMKERGQRKKRFQEGDVRFVRFYISHLILQTKNKWPHYGKNNNFHHQIKMKRNGKENGTKANLVKENECAKNVAASSRTKGTD